jgi:hypothetical protein
MRIELFNLERLYNIYGGGKRNKKIASKYIKENNLNIVIKIPDEIILQLMKEKDIKSYPVLVDKHLGKFDKLAEGMDVLVYINTYKNRF